MNERTNRPEPPLFVVALLLALAIAWPAAPAFAQPPGETTVLRAARVLDGRGEVLENRDLVVRDGRIAEIVPRGAGRGDRVYDLTALTMLPGYIDTHVHIGNHFDDDGKVHRQENDPSAAHVTLHGAENAYRTLMNGITTMQSLGSPRDADLRAWIDRGKIPGPRLLSSLGAVREDTGTPDEIRAYVRDRAAAGADVIKVFASTSIRFGGVTNLSAAQLEAACGEARAQGLRSVVHLHRSDALRLTADAGCTQVEHGWMLEPEDVDVFVDSGMYLGNQIDLLFRNYEERGDSLRRRQGLHAGRVRQPPGVAAGRAGVLPRGGSRARRADRLQHGRQRGQPRRQHGRAGGLRRAGRAGPDGCRCLGDLAGRRVVGHGGPDRRHRYRARGGHHRAGRRPADRPRRAGPGRLRDARGARLQERPAGILRSLRIPHGDAPQEEQDLIRNHPLLQVVENLPQIVPRNHISDAPAWSRIVIIDVLWGREPFPNRPQRRHTVSSAGS